MSLARGRPQSEKDEERGKRREPEGEDDEEDDYMTMTFAEAPPKPETSLQRRQREKREAERRAGAKSKAELAAEETARRESALRRSLLVADDLADGEGGGGGSRAKKKSVGLAMMARMGFKGGALGAADNPDARAEPLPISVKEGRGGIGADAERKRALEQAAAEAEDRVKRARVAPGEYRDRVRRERETARLERLVHAAQTVAEHMDDDEDGDGDGAEARSKSKSRPLKAVNVLWRGAVRRREVAERDLRMRRDVEQSLESSLSRLPTYEDDLDDPDEKLAMGRTAPPAVVADDLDDEDPELDEFEALPPDEKLQRLVGFLRSEHRYCFWCKFEYPDATMDGCPGLTEEDHD